MNRNIEIKANLRNYSRFKSSIVKIFDNSYSFHQIDTYFDIPVGRLKFREESNGNCEIIFYSRDNQKGPKVSYYKRYPVKNPLKISALFKTRFGVRGIVEKKRTLYKKKFTRIHFDEVYELGNFIELELILNPNLSFHAAKKSSKRIMNSLGIVNKDYIAGSYIDLKEKTNRCNNSSVNFKPFIYDEHYFIELIESFI